MESHFISTNGITLHTIQAGPEEGPLVLLLHGFPEFWYGWRHQIAPLAGAGFRVWAPDLRGYNRSAKPPDIRSYAIEHLTADVAGLIRAAGRSTAAVVGHDWGGMVAWQLALRSQQLLDHLIILNIPHPHVIRRALRRSPRQMLRSGYAAFFQLPWLPEKLLGLRNWALAARMLRQTSRPGTFTPADLVRYREAWSQPGAMTAMLNWYRAALWMRDPPQLRVTTPTLMLWGKRDPALGAELAQPSIELCEQGRLVFFPDATHWVQHEEAERVNHLLLDFLRSN